jgi:enoyl-CoA hydratase/carnithine racemase
MEVEIARNEGGAMDRTFETLSWELADRIATIRLNRPDQMNAFTAQMRRDLISAFDATDADDGVRAVIVTGEGRAFCAGADLSKGEAAFDFASRPAAAQSWEVVNGVARDGGGQLALRIFQSLKPVIGAVNGAAVGVGASLLLPMDIRLASTEARFGFVFARRGMTPDGVASWFLPRLVGPSTALEWCYSGRVFAAVEARERGLVRSVHAPAELLASAREIAREIADQAAPVSVALTRRLIWRALTMAHPMETHRADSRAIRARGASRDPKEGVTAFLQKRAPEFVDRVSTDLPDVFPGWVEPEFR